MAKSRRASNKKTNRTKLRQKVFGPVEDARTERLSAQLMEIANSAKARDVDMVEGSEVSNTKEDKGEGEVSEKMDLDGPLKANSKKHSGGIRKRKSAKKARNSITFGNSKNRRRDSKTR